MAFNRMLAKHQRKPQTGFLKRFSAALACTLLVTTLAFAQGVRGNIRGTVTDPNGAVVKGAAVTLIDVARQTEVRTVQTNDDGEYQFLELEPTIYNIRITASGFTEALLRETKVEPNRSLQLDATLTVGGQPRRSLSQRRRNSSIVNRPRSAPPLIRVASSDCP